MFKFLRHAVVQDLILVLICVVGIAYNLKSKSSHESTIIVTLLLQLQINDLKREIQKVKNKDVRFS